MSITPAGALRRLREGNERFSADPNFVDDHLEGDVRRPELTGCQEPFAAVLGCSDSRVPVEEVFGQGPGQLFVVRVAGNVVTPTQLGSLEFAVVELGVRLIVVLGHSGCGAVAATLDRVSSGGSSRPPIPHFESIIERISRAVLAAPPSDRESGPPEWEEAVERNVRQSCADIRSESTTLAELIRSHALRVVGAVYDVESGRVEFVDDMRAPAEH
jgi:carbonic anhydrase